MTVTGIPQMAGEEFTDKLRAAVELLAAGRIKPVIGQTFALREAANAHAAIGARAAIGTALLMI